MSHHSPKIKEEPAAPRAGAAPSRAPVRVPRGPEQLRTSEFLGGTFEDVAAFGLCLESSVSSAARFGMVIVGRTPIPVNVGTVCFWSGSMLVGFTARPLLLH